MILEGAQRGGALRLAQHLLNSRDNDHVDVHEISGFAANDPAGAFVEAEAVSKGTQCRQFFFSLSLSPPESENVSVDVFEDAISRVEQKMGLTGQPRVVIFHEKMGRRHAHCVWSRIDVEVMKAINLPHFKLKLTELSRLIYLEQNWRMPRGFEKFSERDPLNYGRVETAQAKRAGRDARALKALFQKCWTGSDSRAAFANALKENGYILARGDRRGFVAVDAGGKVFSLSRWADARKKELRARLGDPDKLPDVEQAQAQFARCFDAETFEEQGRATTLHKRRKEGLEQKRAALAETQRRERKALKETQDKRWQQETKTRSSRFPTGVKAAWAKLTGAYFRIVQENESQTARALARDRTETQKLVQRHLKVRRALAHEYSTLEFHHDLSLKAVARDAGARLRTSDDAEEPALTIPEGDPAQPLILPPDEDRTSVAAKLARDPVYILEVIAARQEEFSRTDILRRLASYIPDPEKLRLAADKVMAAPELVEIKSDPAPRYATENFLIAKASLMAKAREMHENTAKAVPEKHIGAAISWQNTVLQNTVGADLSHEQEDAIRHVLAKEQLSCVIGLAGSGKSTLLSAAHHAWQKQGLRVIGAALAGKAAEGLESASGIESRTLASLEHGWKNGYGLLGRGDVLVIDEAGMIGTGQLLRFVETAKKAGAKLVLIGDPEQLQPIEAGRPFRDIALETGAARLGEIRRQRESWQRDASFALSEGNGAAAIAEYRERGFVKTTTDASAAIAALVRDYKFDVETAGDNASRLAFAHRRKDVHAINQSIRAIHKSGGKLTGETLFQTVHGPRAFAQGDRIVFTKNDYDLDVRNGSFGTVTKVGDRQLTVKLDKDGTNRTREIIVAPERTSTFDHGYAVTIHKSQGATVDNAYILAGTTMDKHLTYVALTRHRDNMHLYADPAFLRRMERDQIMETRQATESMRKSRRRNHGPTMH